MSFDIYETTSYFDELAALPDSFQRALDADIAPFAQWLLDVQDKSMHAIGAGGSLAIAQIAASLHELVSRRLSRASTPLDFFTRVTGPETVGLAISASGKHRDIRTIATSLATASDADRWSVFLGTEDSPAAELLAATQARAFTAPVLPDNHGWLSIGALLGQSVVIARAYSSVFPELGAVSSNIVDYLPDDAADVLAAVASLAERGAAALARPHLSVLYGVDGLPGALDIDSKFAESGLGPLSMSEYRNFAHGRYQMLLPEPHRHGIVALASTREQRLADTVMEVLPESLPGIRVTIRGESPVERAISGIMAALVLIGALAQVRGIRLGWGSRDTFGDVIYEMPLEDVVPPSVTA